MKAGKLALIIVAAMAVAGGGYVAYARIKTPQTAAETLSGQQVDVRRGALETKVTASGSLTAPRKVSLTFGSGGIIKERLVDIGDSVKKGQVLARLDTLDLERAVKDAESGVKSAEKALKDLSDLYDLSAVAQAEAGLAAAQAQVKSAEKALQDMQPPYNVSPYTLADIAQAEAALASAQAQVKAAERAVADVQPPYNLSPYTPADIAQAEAAVADAEAQVRSAENAFNKAQATMTNEDIAHLRAAVDNAQKALALAQQDMATAKLSRDRSVADAQESLRQEQEKYRAVIKLQLVGPAIYLDPSVILGTDTVGDRLQTAYQALLKVRDNARIAEETGDKNVAAAEAAVTRAQDVLRKAQEDLQRKGTDVSVDLAVRERQLDQAKAVRVKAQEDLKKRKSGPEALEVIYRQLNLENARASLVKAQEDLKKRKDGPDALEVANRHLALDNARFSLVKVQEDLKKKKAGPEALDLAIRNAQLAAAKATLAKAEDNLVKATIVAAFDGVVSGVSGDAGDSVGATSAVVVMIDPTRLRVEAVLDETSVVQVRTGQEVQISLDALPNLSMKGTVTSIAPVSVVQSGVVNYQVFIFLNLDSGAAPRQSGAVRRPTSAAGQGVAGSPTGGRGGPSAAGSGSGAQRQARQTPTEGPSDASGNNTQAPLPPLRAGMTAIAEIVTQRSDNVLLVPRQAVGGSGRNRSVKVVVGAQVETRPVQIGRSDEQFVEVVEGLSEGDKVQLTTPTTRTVNPVGGSGGGFGGGGFGVGGGLGGPPVRR